jgi:hypothetical protein
MAARQCKSSRTIRSTRMLNAALLTGVFAVSGCVSYTNVPEPTSALAFESANHFQSIKVTRTALEEVVFRYPMRDGQGRYSINLPAGTTLESAQSIVRNLPEGVVIPYEGMDESIPMYHIGRIWIRASDAKVDVLYPARAFDGSAFEGTVTVWMSGGVQPWRVARVQHWAPGTIATPPVYVPLPKAELEMMSDDDEPRDDAQSGGDAARSDAQPAPDSEPEVTMPEAVPEPAVEANEQDEQGDPNAIYRQVPIDD